MYNKILIVSDNLSLCKEVKNLFVKRNISVDFSCSPFSDAASFEKELKEKISVFNLKNIDDINKIIQTYDLVISIHCKQIFPEQLVNNVKCINVHPGYNPINRGWYPQVFAIINNNKIGATIHEIDNLLDHGPIIDRDFVNAHIYDTSGTLYNKILKLEIELLDKNLDNILENNYKTIIPENAGNLYLKKDFNNLCHIDLNEEGRFIDFINRLRALTHFEFKNAYFIDPETKEKVYISLNITNERENIG